ncbi:ATP-binding protein [Streptomyces coelicoflavus]|uniref:ATP-binding protein n=2 Tax=Streptomyces coelicoflavus TaxID=285562 RepID=A0A7K3PK50_9ACTN|nr:ATP-binding protein [Streptomyces coelicoflavus]
MSISCVVVDDAVMSGLHSVRGVVREQLRHWDIGELADDAALIVTELLGNAFRHGRPPVRVSLTLDESGDRTALWIAVGDAGPAVDIGLLRAKWRHPSGRLSTDGRGLRLVDALAHSWGDRPGAFGHTVWARLDRQGRRHPNGRRHRSGEDRASVIPVL